MLKLLRHFVPFLGQQKMKQTLLKSSSLSQGKWNDCPKKRQKPIFPPMERGTLHTPEGKLTFSLLLPHRHEMQEKKRMTFLRVAMLLFALPRADISD